MNQPATHLRAVDPDAAPAVDQAVAPAPAGLAWTIHPVTGERTLTYAVPEQPVAEPVPVVQAGPDVWPKRLVAGGGSLAAVVAAVGYAGPGLSAAGHAVEMGGVGVGIAAASLGGLAILAKGALGGGKSGQQVNVNVNVTNTSNSTATATGKGRRR